MTVSSDFYGRFTGNAGSTFTSGQHIGNKWYTFGTIPLISLGRSKKVTERHIRVNYSTKILVFFLM